MVQISFIMVISMLVNIQRVNLMEKVNINGQMETPTLANLNKG